MFSEHSVDQNGNGDNLSYDSGPLRNKQATLYVMSVFDTILAFRLNSIIVLLI
jgi:hypothetical protein